jgi:trans-aconitate methyltransferase
LKEKIILNEFNKIGLNVKDIAVAGIGCGIDFWTDVFKNNCCKNYLDIDVSESAIEKLKKLYPDYRFICADISELVVEEKFDLVFMIDVTQHIVDDEQFRKSMGFVKSILIDN